jgi:biotin transport system substrate-specific component
MSEIVNSSTEAGVIGGRMGRRVLAVLFFAILTGLSASVAIPMPGTMVPVTLQSMIVSLAGVLLGPGLGAASQAAYLAAGALGAPVFANGAMGLGHLLGPTGGYLLAFPIAAAVTGRLAGRIPSAWTVPSVMRLGAAILIGTAVIFAGGAAQLTLLTGDPGKALELGVLPFIAGDLLKVAATLLVALRYRRRTLGWL